MNKISVVIITCNAERKLNEVLKQARKLTDDIIIIDSGSTDTTKQISLEQKTNFTYNDWQGYGEQKNYGNQLSKYQWILSIDADEVISDSLIGEIQQMQLTDVNIVYSIPFKNIYCGKIIKHGRWKNERHLRLFNKEKVKWDTKSVHEGLINYAKIKNLHQPIYHYSMESKADHLMKAKKYALLGAAKLFKQGKKATFVKRFVNPIFRFVTDYFFRLGFLDGKLGFQLAYIISKETYWKYKKLHQMNLKNDNL